jgi:Domain of unknown function (DUF4384)
MGYAKLTLAMLLLTPLRVMAAAPDPPVRVKLSHDRLIMGERAKVYVQAATDGYLLVLRMDTQGNVRVLFPVDPTDNAAIRGGHKFEVRSRGDRDAFTVSENRGGGVVLAVRADHPFTFAGFTTGHHWNAAALAPDSGTGGDPQAALLGIVDRMTDGHYDYDAVNYTVGAGGYGRPAYAGWYGPWHPGPYALWAWNPYYYGPRFGFGITVGPRFFGHGRR